MNCLFNRTRFVNKFLLTNIDWGGELSWGIRYSLNHKEVYHIRIIIIYGSWKSTLSNLRKVSMICIIIKNFFNSIYFKIRIPGKWWTTHFLPLFRIIHMNSLQCMTVFIFNSTVSYELFDVQCIINDNIRHISLKVAICFFLRNQ